MVRKNSGFTMVELMIVIAIIGILAVTLIPAFSGMQNRAKDTGSMAIIESSAVAIDAWSIDANSRVFLFSGSSAERYALASYVGPAGFSSIKPGSSCIQGIDSGAYAISSAPSALITTRVDAPSICGSNRSIGYIPASSSSSVTTRDSYVIWVTMRTQSRGNLGTQIANSVAAGSNLPSVLSNPGTVLNGRGFYAIHGATRANQ